MRRIGLLIVLFAAISSAQAEDYYGALITGVGLAAGDGLLRFTIDRDPNAIFTTSQFTGEQLKRVTAVILSAYHAQSPVAFIRSDTPSPSVRTYVGLTFISLSTITTD